MHDFGREALESLLDLARGFRPDAVGVRVIRAPHHRLRADVVDQLGADRVALECRLAPGALVFGRNLSRRDRRTHPDGAPILEAPPVTGVERAMSGAADPDRRNFHKISERGSPAPI